MDLMCQFEWSFHKISNVATKAQSPSWFPIVFPIHPTFLHKWKGTYRSLQNDFCSASWPSLSHHCCRQHNDLGVHESHSLHPEWVLKPTTSQVDDCDNIIL